MSEGRKEHRRKILAANAREGQAARIRDQLEVIDKQKKEAAERDGAVEAAKRDAREKKLAQAAYEASRARKVFVAGDVRGNLGKLLTTVEAQVAEVGAFDMLLCVGSFLPEGDEAASLGSYLSGEKKVPLDVYFIDAGAALVHAAPQGRKLCDNLHFFGGYGVREVNGLRIAFLSGRYNPDTYDVDEVDFVGDSFTSKAVSELQKIVTEDRKQRGIDILLTSGWPANIADSITDEAGRPPVLDDGLSWQESCAWPLAELAHAIEPRYHLFGSADLFYQRPPFQVLQRQHICRCIGLGRVGSASKQRKWLHALSLAPMRHMKPEDLKQSPPNITPCPFSGEKRPASDSLLPNSFGPPAKRRAVSQQTDLELPERALSALLAGDAASFESLKDKLHDAVTVNGSAVKQKPVAEVSVSNEPAATPSSTSAPAPDSSPKEDEVKEAPKELSAEEKERKQAAEKYLKTAPLKGVVRFTFDMSGPLGLRLSRDVPPWILEVRDGTLAARKAPKVPVGGVVLAVNGYELKDKENSAATQKALQVRPVILDVEWPIDQTMPAISRA
jgi:hypothetical protein